MSRRHLAARVLAGFLVVGGGTAGCGSDPGPGPGPGPGPSPTIAITITPEALSIPLGGIGTLVASIVRGGGFTGTVTIVTEGAPTGVTATVSNVTTSGTTTTGTVTIAVAASVDPGSSTLTIRASGSGVADATRPLQLTITTPPSISLAADPASATVIQGNSTTSLITITRRSFVSDVTLAVEGLPTGATGSFVASPTAQNSAVLTLQTAATTPPGVYPLVIRGTGNGIAAATVGFELRVNEPPSYTIAAVDPDPKSIARGGASTVSVALTRVNFTGTVTLSLEDAPGGVTGTFTPAAVTGASTTLNLQVGAAVPVGHYTLTIRGSAPPLVDRTRTFVLTVTGPVQGTYTLSTVPATNAAVLQGGTTNVTINVNRLGGFAGSVALAVTGAPPGLMVSVSPANVAGATATLTLQAIGTLPIGSYPLVIRGSTPGLNDVPIGINAVVSAPAPGGNVTLDFAGCALGDRPIWLAYQDGTTGPWTRVVGNADSYSFNVANTKGGVVYVTSTGVNSTAVSFLLTSRSGLQLSNAGLCPARPATKSLIGTVANLGPGQLATISLGGGTAIVAPGQSGFMLATVRSGTFDLLGYARGPGAVLATDRFFLRRGVNTAALADGASVGPVLDFGGSESATPQSATITVANIAGGEEIVQSMSYQTGATCESGILYAGMSAGPTSMFTAYGVPAALQMPGETHGLSVAGLTSLTSSRSVTEYFTGLGARSVSLPSALPVFEPNVLGGPYKRLQFPFTLPAELNGSVSLSYADAGGQHAVSLSAIVDGYLDGLAVDLSVPDLSGLPGWDNGWAPVPTTTVNWAAIGAGSNVASQCTAGGRSVSSTRTGTR